MTSALEGSAEIPINLQNPNNPPLRDDVKVSPNNTGMQKTPNPPAGSPLI